MSKNDVHRTNAPRLEFGLLSMLLILMQIIIQPTGNNWLLWCSTVYTTLFGSVLHRLSIIHHEPTQLSLRMKCAIRWPSSSMGLLMQSWESFVLISLMAVDSSTKTFNTSPKQAVMHAYTYNQFEIEFTSLLCGARGCWVEWMVPNMHCGRYFRSDFSSSEF